MKLSAVLLPSQRWSASESMWRRAEEYGLHAGYTYDHLSWRSFRDKAWFSMIPTLVAAAGVTTTLRLGPLVTSPNFRHPLILAKDLLALDDISDGRLIIGVGSGGTGFDATTLGHEPWTARERHERFVEFTTTLDTLLREPASTIEGTFYPVVDSRQIPGPVQRPRPPLILSALGPKSLALTAQLADGWVSFGSPRSDAGTSTFDAVARQVETLNEQLDLHQRESSSFRRIILNFADDESPLTSFAAFVDWAGRYNELGFDEVVLHWPIADSPFDCDAALFERISTEGREMLARF